SGNKLSHVKPVHSTVSPLRIGGHPMVRKELTKGCDTSPGKSKECLEVARVNLHHQLAASSAGRQDAIGADRHEQVNLGFAPFDHFRDRGVLSAETDSTTDMKTDSGIHLPGPGKNRCGHSG